MRAAKTASGIGIWKVARSEIEEIALMNHRLTNKRTKTQTIYFILMSETLKWGTRAVCKGPQAMERGCEWTSLRAIKKQSITCELVTLEFNG